jgi:ABC-type Fe3+-hydroxamate transport system substrate-binding protein
MQSMRMCGAALLLLLVVLVSGCGGGGSSSSNSLTTSTSTSSYYPLANGKSWSYEVTDSNGTQTTESVTCSSSNALNGISCYGITTVDTNPNIDEDNIVYENWTSAGLVEYGEYDYQQDGSQGTLSLFSPQLIFLNPSLMVGSQWNQVFTENYEFTSGTQTATRTYIENVIGMTPVSVPAGNFNNAIEIQSNYTNGALSTTNWYVSGIGRVKTEIIYQGIVTETDVLQSYSN